MASKRDGREAARAHAAAERAAAVRRTRRNRTLVLVAVVAIVVVAGVVTAVVTSNRAADPSPAAGASAGRTSAPPWPAPTDVDARVRAAGLTLLSAEGTVLHTHQHLSITVDGNAVTVPAEIGIDENAGLSAIHTHDTSGIIHVESPKAQTFTLGQVFTEWNVHLGKAAVGPWENGKDGARLTVFVNRKPYSGDPNAIALTAHEDIDVVVTHDGSTPTPPAPFTFPAGY